MKETNLSFLLCKGYGSLSKRIITYNHLMHVPEPANQISHVAMKYHSDGNTLNSFVFEATTLNEWCGKKGVQSNDFNNWIKNYNGEVWERKILSTYDIYSYNVVIAMSRQIGKEYESGIPGVLELLLCGVEWNWFREKYDTENKLRTKKLHCSETAVIVCKELNIMKPEAVANKLPPCEFWEGQKVDSLMTEKFMLASAEQIK